MKRIILLTFTILLVTQVKAQEHAPEFSVLVRQTNSTKTYFKKVVLEDLVNPDAFDGKYFKIVLGKSAEPLPFNFADKALVTKAATAYYHLSEARKFWLTKLSSDAPDKVGKLVIRLELSNLFDEQGHYAHDNRDPQFNNALSIMEGETPSWVPAHKQDKWGKEIWFRPMKKVDMAELAKGMKNPLTTSLEALEKPFINYTTNSFQQTMAEHIFYPSYVDRTWKEEALIFVGTIALTKAVIEASKWMDRLFLDKYYYLDTVMVPEVIYHEYGHIVLSDSLKMTHSTPVVEGMADYFAAVLSNKRKVYDEVRGHSNSAAKDRKNKAKYSHWLESNRNAAGDFVLAVLWDVREALGDEKADKVIYESRKFMSTDSATISHHLIKAVIDSCQVHCTNPRADKLKLYERFTMRGF